MKLLVLAPQPFFQNRGTPIATLNLLKVLSEAGHQIDLLTYHEGSAVDVTRCRHIRIPNIPFVRDVPPGFSFRKLICDAVMLVYAIRLSFRHDYHLVHAVEESVFMAMLIKTLTGTPYVYDMDSSLPQQLTDQMPHLQPFRPFMRWCENRAVRNSNGVVAVCRSLEEVVTNHSKEIPVVRIEDASLLTPQPNNGVRRIAADTVLNLEGRVLMYVGNLQPYQGIDLLLNCFTHAYHRFADVQLVIIGGSDANISRYREDAQRFGIDDRTHFLGARPVEQLDAYLKQADVVISPRTHGNNTPMKIYSYMECEKPVLATRLPMHTQVLDDKVAMLVKPTPLEMARGVSLLLENVGLRQRLAGAAKKKLNNEFSPKQMNLRISEFYKRLAINLGVN